MDFIVHAGSSPALGTTKTPPPGRPSGRFRLLPPTPDPVPKAIEVAPVVDVGAGAVGVGDRVRSARRPISYWSLPASSRRRRRHERTLPP